MPKISELPSVVDPTTAAIIPIVEGGVTSRATLNSLPVSTDQQAAIDAHANLTTNPHSVTKTQVGLGNVDNTSDVDKPISTATQAALDLKVPRTSTTGTANIPSGNTAQRDTTGGVGIRYNTTLLQFEGYNGSAWGAIGGGVTGAPGNAVFIENDTNVTADYTITTNKNAGSFGPITIDTGVTVTVPTGSVWSIV